MMSERTRSREATVIEPATGKKKQEIAKKSTHSRHEDIFHWGGGHREKTKQGLEEDESLPYRGHYLERMREVI